MSPMLHSFGIICPLMQVTWTSGKDLSFVVKEFGSSRLFFYYFFCKGNILMLMWHVPSFLAKHSL